MTDSNYDVQAVRSWLQGLQTDIADTLGAFDGTAFATDSWQRAPGEKLRGGGTTRILEGGQFFARESAFPTLPAMRCRARPAPPARSSPDAASRQWAYRSCCTRTIRTARPCI
jgi:coproporphyrinogen III oxidase